jgi:hypothetical protein
MRPLAKGIRKSMFISAFLLFVVGTPLLIGYSKGYRIGSDLFIVHTGGIYLHSDIPRASVWLDGKYVEDNGAFFRNTLVQDLVPNREYTIRMQKDGYHNWVKKLFVFPDLVTEASVLMLPRDLAWETVSSTTLSVEGVVSTTTNPAFISLKKKFLDEKDQFAVEVATTTYVSVKGKRVATTTQEIEYRFPSRFADFASTTHLAKKHMVRERDSVVSWLDEGNLHLAWVDGKNPPPYFFCRVSCATGEKDECVQTCDTSLVINWDSDITRYDFYPGRNDVVVLASKQGIYAVELDNRSERNIQPIREGLSPSGEEFDFRVFGNGTLTIFDGSFLSTSVL